MRLSHLPAVLALCGAGLLGWSVSGVASVDRTLQAAPAPLPVHHCVMIRR